MIRDKLGSLLTSLITAGVIAGSTATAGVTVLVFRANAVDDRVEKIDDKQRDLSESVAVLIRESQWTNSQLAALLAAQGVKVPPPAPIKGPRGD